MCYLIRQQQAQAELSPTATPPSTGQLRPRWIGAAAFALVGSLAVAAAFVTQPPTERLNARDIAATAPLGTTPVQSGSLERASLQSSSTAPPGGLVVDDEVPTAPGAKSAFGHCEHGL